MFTSASLKRVMSRPFVLLIIQTYVYWVHTAVFVWSYPLWKKARCIKSAQCRRFHANTQQITQQNRRTGWFDRFVPAHQKKVLNAGREGAEMNTIRSTTWLTSTCGIRTGWCAWPRRSEASRSSQSCRSGRWTWGPRWSRWNLRKCDDWEVIYTVYNVNVLYI